MPMSGCAPGLVMLMLDEGGVWLARVAKLTVLLSSEMTGLGGVIEVIRRRANRPVVVNVIVRAPATPLMPRFVNVATPPTVVALVVPDRVPPPLASAAVTVAVAVDTRLPAASRISITG
jgi:hypothetical protein